VDPRKVLKKHRYVYGVANAGKSTFLDSIVKYDVDTQTAKLWTKHGHTAGEPIFVPNPAENDEDSGVLLSVVLDGILGKSYLLVLDAKDLTELGKAHVDGVIGFGFHGAHVPAMRAEGAERGVIDF
jgi:torulene dioxygenase